MKISRRAALKTLAAVVPSACISKAFGADGTDSSSIAKDEAGLPPAPTPITARTGFGVASGPFQPTWQSLSQYQIPDWYRDAKLGIWAHWGPQCQPQMGDWYAQRMYQTDGPIYKFHVQKYGHPSQFGFKDVINQWKADQWQPAELIALYKKAGAKFFAAMANHHDNFDMFNSKYQPWNSVSIGPKKDIVGGWAKAAREAGLRFAITSHGDRAWSWYQAAQGSDKTGPLAGVPYDGRTTAAQGKGMWWEGLDPQDLYAQYHTVGKYDWPQNGTPPIDPAFIEKFFNRTIDLIDQYHPDLLYFDDTILPLYPVSDIGLRIAAYLYNTNLARNGGKLEAVLTGKHLQPDQRRALVLDVERGVTTGSETLSWQTDTCIGSWHYDHRIFDQHKYKTAKQVVQMLIDIVSKNGNLMLNIPVRGDGTIDEDEVKVLEGLAAWIEPHGEAIFDTHPWKVYGEGPSTEAPPATGQFGGAKDVRPYTAEDIRYTSKGESLYCFFMGWPASGKLTLKKLAEGSENYPQKIGRIELLGLAAAPLAFDRTTTSLAVTLPDKHPNEYACALKISPA
ncbi:MAG TPA: alpha-L-fucosidase [Pirellulales bacterium]|jgi:alpha-L-fucosidase|nr:alpha-L-fucosidase [Pirellulales bacterium]